MSQISVSEKQLKEICRRSENGEGVEKVVTEMFGKDNTDKVMIFLRDNHHKAIVDAKQAQISRRGQKIASANGE